MEEGPSYNNKEEYNNRLVQGPLLRIPLTNITPIHQIAPWISGYPVDGTDYKELTMVLYHQMSNQDTRIEAIEADKEN